jgi:hypothetical protein
MALRNPCGTGAVAMAHVDKTDQAVPGNHLEILCHIRSQHPRDLLAVIPDAVDIPRPDIGNIVLIRGIRGRWQTRQPEQTGKQIQDRTGHGSIHTPPPHEIVF